MTHFIESISECTSHLQTVEHLLECAKLTAYALGSADVTATLDDALQQCKTLASLIDEIENEAAC